MANMFGIEYESPAEIKTQQQVQFQKAEQQAAGDPVALGRIAQQKAISNLFGSPELKAAKAKQQVLEEVQKSTTKMDGEDDFDYQLRLAETIREKAAEVSPELALQANDQILNLRNSQLQQRRLKGQVEMEDIKLAEAKDVAVLSKQGWVFERQKDGELRPVRKLSDTQPSEEDLARFEELRQENPNLVLGSGLDVLKIENLLTGRGKGGSGINNSTQQKHLEGLTATKGFARDVANFATTLAEDVEALGLGRDVAGGLDAAMAMSERLQSQLLEDAKDPESALKSANEAFDRVFGEQGLTTASALAKAQVKAMAYKLAKALDPGGRLSDQDVEMAIEMIIGSGRSGVIEKLLRERLASTYEGIEASIDLANAGLVFGDVGIREVERMEKVMAEAREGIALYNAGIQEAKKPGRKGIDPGAPAPAADEQPVGTQPKPTHRFNPATGKIEAI